MKINPLDNHDYVVSVSRVKMVKKSDPGAAGDKLDVSDRARELAKSEPGLPEERLQLIRERIASDYYSQDDVLKEVASRVLRSQEMQQFLENGDMDKNTQ